MEGNPAKSGGGGGGGPAPFLLKTYDMIDDSATDEIVSWSPNQNSFVVWNPPEFARLLLPTYFKHNNFSSFIRQLNTYGFKKIDSERWEFANEDFVKNQKYLLKNIHRRKPIHSHSNPQGSTVDPERAGYEEEIDKLSREKSALEKSLLRFKQQQPAAKIQLEELAQRVQSMEQRQDNLLVLLKKSLQDPVFVDHLARKLESMDFSAYNKKRRLPGDISQTVLEDGFIDDHGPYRPEFGNVFHHDFANKLRLELTPVASDVNLVSNGTQSSDGGSPQVRSSEDCFGNTQISPGGPPLAPEPLELSDTGTSFGFDMDSSFSRRTEPCEPPSLHHMQPGLNTNEESESECHLLNLTLASCASQSNTNPNVEIGKPSEWASNEPDFRFQEKNRHPSAENVTLASSQGPHQAPAATQARVNDVFWEQFLTERPGSSDVEEPSSGFRKDQDDRRSAYGNSRNLQNLTL